MPIELAKLRKMQIGKERWFAAVDMSSHDQEAADLYSSVPDILDQLISLMEEKEACLKYCREQNGLDSCKNCGLE